MVGFVGYNKVNDYGHPSRIFREGEGKGEGKGEGGRAKEEG